MYHDTYGTFPPPFFADDSGRPMHSWRVLLLPFLDQGELYEQYRFDEPWDGPHNRQLLAQRPRIYTFHGHEGDGGTTTNYLAVVGEETVWPPGASLAMSQIVDGATYTILIVENHGAGIHWTEPRDLDLATMTMDVAANAADGVSSRFRPTAVVSAAGYVHKLPDDLPPATLRALLTASGGEDLPLDEHWQPTPDARGRPPR
jgi:hypothetical protein